MLDSLLSLEPERVSELILTLEWSGPKPYVEGSSIPEFGGALAERGVGATEQERSSLIRPLRIYLLTISLIIHQTCTD